MATTDISWQADIELKKRLTKEDSKFIFDQAEKLLKDSIDTGATIVTRTNTLVTILSALIIAISGYVISTWEKLHHFDSVLISSILGLVYLFIIAIHTVRNIAPVPYHLIGSLPINLMIKSFFINSIPSEE